MGRKKNIDDDLQLMRQKAEALFELEKNKIPFSNNIIDLKKQLRELRITQIQQELQVKEELFRSEEKYRTLIEFAPDAFFQGDQKGRIITVNKKATEYTGYSEKELIGMFMADLFSERELKEKPLRFDLLEKGEAVKSERNLLKKNGKTIRVEMNSKKMPDGTYQSFFRDVSERIKAEDELREKEKKFRLLYENAPLSYQSLDVNGCIIDVNPTWLETLGYNRDEVIGRYFGDLMTPESAEMVKVRFPEFVKKGVLHNHIFDMLCKDGSILTVCYEGRIGLDEFGDFKQTHCIFTDITERRRTEKLLADERILLRTIIDNLPDAIYAKDLEGRKLFSNRVDLQNQGLISESQVIGRTDFDIFPEEMARKFHEIDQLVIKKGEPIINHKEKYKFDDNQEHWIVSSKFPLKNEQGEIIGLVGISRDITKKVLADQEILKLTTGMNQSPASIIITNIKGEIEYVNKKFVETSGYSELELKGQMLRVLKQEHTPDEVFKTIWDNLEKGIEFEGEHLNKRKNNEPYWESVLLSPIKNKEDEITNFIIISTDITRSKKMEADLIKAKEKAEESDRLKTAFLNNMSHEIRTPLNAIVGFSELLTDPDIAAEESNYYIEILHNSSDQLLHIISDIINISTIDAGQMVAVPKRMNVNNMLISLSEQFLLSNKNKNIELRYVSTLNDEEALIETDETKLTQTMSNLIVNALKFTEKGKVEFGVTKKESFLHFWVEDTGIGISEEMHEKIFERFRQANSSITKIYGGTGLGLSIAKSFIELLGGQIGLTSKIGEGSKFYFSIPYLPAK